MIIWFDMDGVLCDMGSLLCAEYNRQYNTQLTPKDITKWELPEEMKAIYRHSPGFFKRLSPIPGMLDLVNELSKKHEIHIATDPGRRSWIAADKMEWLCFYNLNHIPVTLTERKDLLIGNILIDDAPHHAQNFKGFSILVDAPYNQDVKESIFLIRAKGNDIAASIKTIVEELEYADSQLPAFDTA